MQGEFELESGNMHHLQQQNALINIDEGVLVK